MSLPNNDRNNVILGSSETVASTVLNRSISRLHQNDLYLDKFVGKVAIDSSDLSAIENASVYLENKIVPGSGITITVDDTIYGKALRIYASTDQVVSSVLSGVYVSGAIVADNIAAFAGSIGTSAYIKDSTISITTVSDHLVDYDNPHQVTLSSLIGVNVSGAVNNDILMLSGMTWVATPNPLLSISASFDDDRNTPLSAKAILYYGETQGYKVGDYAASNAAHSQIKIIDNNTLVNGTKYAYVVFTGGLQVGTATVNDPNSMGSADDGISIKRFGHNVYYNSTQLDDIVNNQLKFKHLNRLYTTAYGYMYYTYQGTFIYDDTAFDSSPNYIINSGLLDVSSQFTALHTTNTTLNYLKLIGEVQGTTDLYKGTTCIFIFEYDFLKWYLGGLFNDPISDNSVYHNGSSLFGV